MVYKAEEIVHKRSKLFANTENHYLQTWGKFQ